MADYTDQLLNTDDSALNTYYRCGGLTNVDKNWTPKACYAVIRSDRLTQALSIEEGVVTNGAHQKYYCHCNTMYRPWMVCFGEILDNNENKAYYFRAQHPR